VGNVKRLSLAQLGGDALRYSAHVHAEHQISGVRGKVDGQRKGMAKRHRRIGTREKWHGRGKPLLVIAGVFCA
jgi:hypothetical protein